MHVCAFKCVRVFVRMCVYYRRYAGIPSRSAVAWSGHWIRLFGCPVGVEGRGAEGGTPLLSSAHAAGPVPRHVFDPDSDNIRRTGTQETGEVAKHSPGRHNWLPTFKVTWFVVVVCVCMGKRERGRFL